MTTTRRGKTGESETVSGVVARHALAAGSKSARNAIGIVEPAGSFVPIHVIGDNPFVESSLRPLIGCQIELKGQWRNGMLRVRSAALTDAKSASTHPSPNPDDRDVPSTPQVNPEPKQHE